MAALGRSFFGRFFGRTIGEGAAFALGTAAGPALRPAVQELANAAWSRHPVRPPDVYQLAAGVAQGQVPRPEAEQWAAENGYDTDRFAALVNIANVGPGVAAAFELWRRDVINEAGFRRAVKRLGLEQEWIDDLVKIKTALLDEAQLANAIHRGLIDDAGLMPVSPPTGTGKVPKYPTYPIDALIEAAGQGIDRDRLGVLVGLTGLPMGSHEAAQAVFRGVIEPVDYERAIAEGNTRNEWGEAIFEQSRQIPSATNYVEQHIRGWSTEAQMHAGAARHGMTTTDADVLFQIHGRPPSWHQVWIGLARGGVYDGPTGEIDPAFLKSLRESDLRPEWYNLLWHSRYTYPSAFVLRSLTQSAEITEAEAHQILLFQGWEPKLAAKVAATWAGGGATGAAADPLVKKAQTQLWGTLHKAYVDFEASEATATATLAALGALDPAAVLALWDRERLLVRTELTTTQIKKAYVQTVLTEAEATTKLEQLGMTLADIHTLLHS